MRYVVGRGASRRRSACAATCPRRSSSASTSAATCAGSSGAPQASAPTLSHGGGTAMTTARVLFTLWPFTAHLSPQMSIAVALRERGHEWPSTAARRVRSTGGAGGLRVLRVRARRRGARVSATCARSRRAAGRAPAARRRSRGSSATGSWRRSPPSSPTSIPVLDRWRPDVIGDRPVAVGPDRGTARVTARPGRAVLDLHGSADPGPGRAAVGVRAPSAAGSGDARGRAAPRPALTELRGSGLRRRVDEIRAGHGLAPLGESVNALHGAAAALPRRQHRRARLQRQDLPFTVHYVGHCIWRPTAPRGDGGVAGAHSHRPSLGPRRRGHPGARRRVPPARGRTRARGEPVEVIITTGRGSSSDVLGLGAAPRNVHLSECLRRRRPARRAAPPS